MPPLQPGTLNLLILRALADGPRHGFSVVSWLGEVTGGALEVEEGALYHALHRMARQGWLEAEWGASANNRQAKYYRLTAAGRRELRRQEREWRHYTSLVGLVLAPTRRPS